MDHEPDRKPDRWSAERAWDWFRAQPRLVGCNYVPSNAINPLEMFAAATWDAETNRRELGWAAGLRMNCVRVFLHEALWAEDPAGLRQRLGEFLAIAAEHGLRVLPVLFDSCWNPEPVAGAQPEPVPGVHNSGWSQSPGRVRLGAAFEDSLQAYVAGIVAAFAQDQRVLGWDLWNEPDNRGGDREEDVPAKIARVNELLPRVFAWARDAGPSQPLTSGVWVGSWTDATYRTAAIQLAESDFVTFHNYGWPEEWAGRVQELQALGRPVVCTEYMARGAGSTFDGVLPLARALGVGVMNWGLVAGKTQTFLPWDSWERPYVAREPLVWFHDVLRADGTPYRPREAELLREPDEAGQDADG